MASVSDTIYHVMELAGVRELAFEIAVTGSREDCSFSHEFGVHEDVRVNVEFDGVDPIFHDVDGEEFVMANHEEWAGFVESLLDLSDYESAVAAELEEAAFCPPY